MLKECHQTCFKRGSSAPSRNPPEGNEVQEQNTETNPPEEMIFQEHIQFLRHCDKLLHQFSERSHTLNERLRNEINLVSVKNVKDLAQPYFEIWPVTEFQFSCSIRQSCDANGVYTHSCFPTWNIRLGKLWLFQSSNWDHRPPVLCYLLLLQPEFNFRRHDDSH